MARLPLVLLTALAGALALVAFVQPINSTLTRLLILAGLAGFYLGVVALGWRRRRVSLFLLFIPVLLGLLVLLPGRPTEPTRLCDRYVAALERYVGTPYVWGGEGRFGIDCSGLPRRALRDALWEEGLSTMNTRLFREALLSWWFDASAAALAAAHRNATKPLGESGILASNRFANLRPGDLAVTTSGIHCLAYLGNDRWIQADPSVGRVAIFDARSTDNGWFQVPATTHRWSIVASD